MRPLVTPAEMRRADEEAISGGTAATVLMDRAGRAVARVVLRETRGRYGKRVTIVCGKGNNGGDGLVAARVLHREGLRVVCCILFDPREATGAAKFHLDLLRASGCRVTVFDARHLQSDVIVDAVFGTGFRGEITGAPREALDAVAQMARKTAGERRPRVVSVDVPSAGLVPADVTVALGAEKLQTFFDDGARESEVVVADIGIPVRGGTVFVVDPEDIQAALPRLDPDDHKTSHGTVVVLAGSDRTTGAALLAARAAARMGAGYVTLASTQRVIDAAHVTLPEVLKEAVAPREVLGPDALDHAAAALDRSDAVALGPGLGTGDQQRQLVERALREVAQPLVLDADALNVLAGRSDILAERDAPLVLTPHSAELGGLLGRSTAEVVADRVTVVLEAAERFGCAVVLKGRNTLVATRSTVTAVAAAQGPATAYAIPAGGPELATAGTGDVLTGALAALLARHREAPATTVTAAACYVHGVAGSVAAERVGATGVMAWDVCEALPEAVRRLRATYAPYHHVFDES
ncbi:MAG: NAD(P)H-hydrate dehydratase [Actinomycetota bacterium]|nr:NAD(P)H-hydrate dehydratase [Actinomycetota bacterium]